MDIIDLTVFKVQQMHLLAIQIHNSTTAKFTHQFYNYSHDFEHVNLVLEFVRDMETIIEPFQMNQQQCFIEYRLNFIIF